MRPILTPFLALYWTAAFAALALTSVDAGDEGAAHVMRMIGFSGLHIPDSAFVAGILAFGLALCAGFFFWAFVQALLDGRIGAADGEAVLRLAFGGAVGISCVLVIAGTFAGAEGGLTSPTALLAALAASYLATAAERWISQALADQRDTFDGDGARAMAIDAARQAMLHRPGDGGNPDVWERPQ